MVYKLEKALRDIANSKSTMDSKIAIIQKMNDKNNCADLDAMELAYFLNCGGHFN
jgi:hypothetical protein